MWQDQSRHGDLMRRALIGTAIISLVLNLLGLTGPFYMLQVYDRVIPSQSVPTLVALSVFALLLFAFSGLLDVLRVRILARFAGIVDASLTERVFGVIAGAPLKLKLGGDILRPAQDLDQIRLFLAGPGPVTFFDLPWLPVYLAACFFLHPAIGWLATGTLVLLLALNFAASFQTRKPTADQAAELSARNAIGEDASRNAEILVALGMHARAAGRWNEAADAAAEAQRRTGDIAGFYSGLSKTIRQVVQSASLGVGAYLVVEGSLSGGAIIAGSIIVARALAPVEQLVANWRGLLSAQQSWKRLQRAFAAFPQQEERTALPPPSRSLSVEGLYVGPPAGGQRLTVQNVSFRLEAGTVLGIIGPSASGKSSLVRAITGAWPAMRGKVCLDGASLDQWSAEARSRHVGYMPQLSDFFAGTIAENIARLERNADPAAIVAAAKAAGAHDMIVALADGYETRLGAGGEALSAGQRQRVALARALYGDPFLVVLDEPNSNLDAEGELALAAALRGIKARGGIAIVVAHRDSVLAVLDRLLIMDQGAVKAFGPRDEIINLLTQPRPAVQRPPSAPALTVVDKEGQS
ncbi:MAG: type I secretion system permease/ATPase [Rhizobium sp.]|nr:type I secretion system permease/ATPase [Rhizobium sp.]